MTTLKEFEDALREQGMQMALAILQRLRERDRAKRSVAPARRIAGRKMTPDLARRILELHATTEMTQQEIAFELGINQGRVNEVINQFSPSVEVYSIDETFLDMSGLGQGDLRAYA